MNEKQITDLIERMRELGHIYSYQGAKNLIREYEKLNKPEKVKVKQFVADWYEENKDDFETSLFQCIYELFEKRNDSKLNEFEYWVIDGNTKPFQTLVDMHRFGYEVEKEKRYTVRIKGVVEDSAYLKHQLQNNHWYYGSLTECSLFSPYHTKKELEEAEFGWVFSCPGIEVKEVKE